MRPIKVKQNKANNNINNDKKVQKCKVGSSWQWHEEECVNLGSRATITLYVISIQSRHISRYILVRARADRRRSVYRPPRWIKRAHAPAYKKLDEFLPNVPAHSCHDISLARV